MTRGGCAADALDVDEAGPAGAERRAIRVLAELRKRNAQTVDSVQHGGASRHFDGPLVDHEVHARRLSATRPLPIDGGRKGGLPGGKRHFETILFPAPGLSRCAASSS